MLSRIPVSRVSFAAIAALLSVAPLSPLLHSAQAQTGYSFIRAISQKTSSQIMDIAVGADGKLYAATQAGIASLEPNGEYVLKITAATVQDSPLELVPVSLAFDNSGLLHVLDGNGAIRRFRNNAHVSSFQIGSPAASGFSDMARDSKGNYYVYSNMGDVLKYSPSGQLLLTIARPPLAPTAGSALAVSALDELHVLRQPRNGSDPDSISVYGPGGQLRRNLELPKVIDAGSISNIFSDPKGNIRVNAKSSLDGGPTYLIVLFSPEGKVRRVDYGDSMKVNSKWVTHFQELSGIAFGPSGAFYTSSATSGEPIMAYERNQHSKIFFTDAPLARTSDRETNFAFASTKNGDLFSCSLDGTPFATCSSPKRYTKLERGSHSFRVMVRGDHRSEKTIRWTVR